MSFVGKDCLLVAQFLGGQINGPCTLEAAQRAAISRAYFAAYGHAFHIEVDSRRYKPVRGGDNHWQLRDHFAKRRETQIASELEDLSIWRKQCDYDKNFIGDLSQTVKNALNNAKHIIEYVKK